MVLSYCSFYNAVKLNGYTLRGRQLCKFYKIFPIMVDPILNSILLDIVKQQTVGHKSYLPQLKWRWDMTSLSPKVIAYTLFRHILSVSLTDYVLSGHNCLYAEAY